MTLRERRDSFVRLRRLTYDVDLGPRNLARLEKALAPFTGAGRRVPGSGGGRRSTSRQGRPSADRAAVRAWAKAAGLKVSERGRITVICRIDDKHRRVDVAAIEHRSDIYRPRQF